ncbi:hypothetical protein F5878DRAFT_616127 [Lentinula raphanica]|uniref:Secreted protein n=1 Tax=Lentinula raphanica TaxID=153919 RepID=A0AA38UFS9_9AGAR|nr:hypothetical protein F5878DRAFT_616127 [Lentinula raphanica]
MTRPALVLPLGIILIILASTVSPDVLAAPTSSNVPGRDTTYASNVHIDSGSSVFPVVGARDSLDVYDRVSSYLPSAGADGSPARQSLTSNSLMRRARLVDDPFLSSRAVAPEIPDVVPLQAAAEKAQTPSSKQKSDKDMAELEEYDTELITVYKDMTSIKPQGTKDVDRTPAFKDFCLKYRKFIETMNDRVPLILESAQPSTVLHDKAQTVDESLQGLCALCDIEYKKARSA